MLLVGNMDIALALRLLMTAMRGRTRNAQIVVPLRTNGFSLLLLLAATDLIFCHDTSFLGYKIFALPVHQKRCHMMPVNKTDKAPVVHRS